MTTNLKIKEGFKSATLLLQQIGRQLPFERLVFIDPRVEDYQSLVAGVLPNTVVKILDVEQDGIQQISQALAFQREIKSIHIVSHGDPGRLYIGNSVLSYENLNRYAGQIRGWANALSADAQILLYGCSVAQTEQGKAFVRRLGELTSAIVAASDDLTGSATLGGDWELEVMTGNATPTLAFADSILEAYSAVLAGVTVSKNPLTVTEAGLTDTYTVVLDTIPTDDVVITINNGNQLNPITTTLTFTPGNSATAQTVTVAAFNDQVAEGDSQAFIEYIATSNDAQYNNISGFVTANIGDNDLPDVIITQTDNVTYVTEDGLIDTYTVKLQSQPTDVVTVNIASTDPSQVTTNITTLTFNASNWDVEQTVTVTAEHDFVAEGDNQFLITNTATSNDAQYNNISSVVTANIGDNDLPGVILTQTDNLTYVTEDGLPDHYTVKLQSQPIDVVTVTITSGNPSQVNANVATLTFDASNWDVEQTVTVTAVNDFIAQGDRQFLITNTATSNDAQYNNISSAVTANIGDNDLPGVILTQTDNLTYVTEDGLTDTYSIKLNSQPTDVVTVNIASTDINQVTTNVASLTFDASNWNVEQTVTVTAINDFVAEGDRQFLITNTATSNDAQYNNISSVVTANIGDNDTAGVILTQTDNLTYVTEDGLTDTYSIKLQSQPIDVVTVTITSGNPSQVNANVATLTFDASNWNVEQTVTVTAINDFVAEGDRQFLITNTATSNDAQYNNISSVVTANIGDNDTAGVILTQTDNLTYVTEDGLTDTYSIKLQSQPIDVVTVTITSGNPSQVNANVATLTFDASNWDVEQTVTVTAVDDFIAQGDRQFLITNTATSNDAQYNNISSVVTANIGDNDTAGVILTQTDNLTYVTEDGLTDTYSIKLQSQPIDVVTVTITSGNPSQVNANVATLTFDASNWDVEQTVTVTAVDDFIAQGDRQFLITNTATSNDAQYNNISSAVTANIGDNDLPGVILTQTDNLTYVTEDGLTDTYSIKLNSQPTDVVTVNIASTDINQVTTNVASLTFDASNWNVEQTVTVTAINDFVAEGDNQFLITNIATSNDTKYNNISSAVTANIGDNDLPGVNANQVGGTAAIVEGNTAVYAITLNSKPIDDVTITITGVDTSQVSIDVTTLTFNASNWNTAQNVRVTAIDDDIEQGDRTVDINYAVTSNDAKYSAIATNSVAIDIIDNDIPLAQNDDNDVFTINGNSNKTQLQVTLVSQSFNFVNELGVFTVDDAQGTIDGIATGAAGYAEAALNRSKVIFSTIANLPDGYNTNSLTRLLELNPGANLRFYLIKNSTSDDVRINKQYGNILFSDSQNAKITDLGGNQFSLAWNDGSSNNAGEFKDLVVNFQSTSSSLVLGTNLQSSAQGEVIDLRSAISQVTAQFVVNREAAFNNFVGFYKVTDENGGIDTNGDGQADIFAGQAGYIQAAVSGRVSGIDLTVNNQGTATYTGTFQPGAIYAPFLIANGNPDAIVDSNTSNDPAVYFTYLGANTDGVDHVRLLGNNIFGFEDLASGGDKDFNDVIVKVTFA